MPQPQFWRGEVRARQKSGIYFSFYKKLALGKIGTKVAVKTNKRESDKMLQREKRERVSKADLLA